MAALSVMVLFGCDRSYPGMEDAMKVDTSTPVPVMCVVGDPTGGIIPSASMQSKGIGDIASMDEWNGEEIYVYAFSRDMQTTFSTTSAEDPLRCLVDGSKDSPGALSGKKGRISNMDAFVEWTGPDALYYHSGENYMLAYDFFAYYLSDVPVTDADYTRTDDAVTVAVEIDGSQDLMSAKAELTTDQLEHIDERKREDIFLYNYSYYTAQLNILPKFFFKHHLVKLDFIITSGLIAGQPRKNVYVESVEVSSKYKADFTVADCSNPSRVGIVFHDDRNNLFLTEEGGGTLRTDAYTVKTLSDPSQIGDEVHVGGCLLVAPDTEYTAYITLREYKEDGTPVTTGGGMFRNEVPVKLDGLSFDAGNQYDVKMTIFGATNVRVTVNMADWEHGGSIYEDTENDKPEL